MQFLAHLCSLASLQWIFVNTSSLPLVLMSPNLDPSHHWWRDPRCMSRQNHVATFCYGHILYELYGQNLFFTHWIFILWSARHPEETRQPSHIYVTSFGPLEFGGKRETCNCLSILNNVSKIIFSKRFSTTLSLMLSVRSLEHVWLKIIT